MQRAIFSPNDRTSATIRLIKERESKEYTVIPFPLTDGLIENYFGSLLPGQLCVVLGQSSNGKSLLLKQWADFLADRLVDYREDEIVIYVDLENFVEDITINELAQLTTNTVQSLTAGKVKDWQELMGAVYTINSKGLYHLAYSSDILFELTLSKIIEDIIYLRDEKFGRKMRIAAIFVDYLQAIEHDVSDPAIRRLKVRQDIYTLRRMGGGSMFDCPIIVGVQAKQKLDGPESPTIYIPGMYDGEESSSIAQRADRVLSTWMPKMIHPIGKMLNFPGVAPVQVTEDMFVIKFNKQRGGLPSGAKWLCQVDYNTNIIKPIMKLEAS